ncbi:MAG: TSUP family transporter, partial [Oscillibacter sp.]|nr:TSUP family transporter [Oscillibacter sp.]
MILLLVFAVCFCSCIVGAICGIGGGVIIKPALDAFGIMDVATISFLSGCTVLSMTAYSVVRSKLSGSSRIDSFTGVPLALGAAIGGVVGKNLFQTIRDMNGDANKVGAIQAA